MTAIRSLARLAEYWDTETGDHLQRIRRYTALLAQEVYVRQPYSFQIGDGYSEDLSVSSMLHDIGKVAVYDALTGRRPYKQPWCHEDAIRGIVGLSGRQFDPVLVDILMDIRDDFRQIRTEYPD